jgi:cation transport ATPase
MANYKFDVTGMTCSACSAHVEQSVRKLTGVTAVNVNLLTNSMTVVGATINKSGSFKFQALQVGDDTALARIIRLVEEASSSKAPIAKLADQCSGRVEKALNALEGVTATVDLAEKTATLTLTGPVSDAALKNAIKL